MRYFLIAFVLLTSGVGYAHAEGFKTVNIYTKPEFPKPKELTSVSIESYSYDLQAVNIKWLVNDRLYKEGVGMTTVSLIAPKAGQSSKVEAVVGELTTTSVALRPTLIDILWEADTTTPWWYMGRALPVDESNIRATAVPHVGTTTGLIYNWYKSGKFLSGLSGAGKDSIVTKAPGIYNDYILSVDILDATGAKLGSSGTKITTTYPEVYLYNVSPLLGIKYWSAVVGSNTDTLGIEPTFEVVPYYFALSDVASLEYKWSMHGVKYTQKSPSIITLLSAAASPRIRIEVTNTKSLLQSASTRITVGIPSRAQQDTDPYYESAFGSSE